MKTKYYLWFLTILFIFPVLLKSQDVIFKMDGDEIEAKVIEVTEEVIKYYKYNKTEGPLYSINVDNVFMIKYPDGSKDVFGSSSKENIKDIKTDTIKDVRDGKKYKIIKIGGQWWMAENLRYETERCRCYDDIPENCKECGYYYKYKEALIACPEGWHLPTDNEWMELEIEVGMSSVEVHKSGWRGTSGGQAAILISGGQSGLDLIFCGTMDLYDGIGYVSQHKNTQAYYWTSTEKTGDNSWIRHFKLRASIDRSAKDKTERIPVRCIKNSN